MAQKILGTYVNVTNVSHSSEKNIFFITCHNSTVKYHISVICEAALKYNFSFRYILLCGN